MRYLKKDTNDDFRAIRNESNHNYISGSNEEFQMSMRYLKRYVAKLHTNILPVVDSSENSFRKNNFFLD